MAASDSSFPCPNCGGEAADRFCPGCGQDNRRPRLETRAVLADTFQNLVGWDSALGRTLSGVVRSPGALAAEYVRGRRRRFVNPARFALLSLAAWLLGARLFGVDPLDASGIKITNSSGNQADVIDGVRTFIGNNLDVLLYLSLPLRAFLLRIFFRGSGRNLAECLVLVLYVAGFGYLLGVLSAPFGLAGAALSLRLRAVISFIWSFRAARGFFGRSAWGTFWRVFAVGFLHMIGTVILFGLIAVPWVLWTSS